MVLFINETTSSVADFMTKLNTFLTTGGGGNPAWTGENLDGLGTLGVDTSTGEAGWSKAALGTNTPDIQVAFQWDTGAPRYLGVYQYDHASGVGNYDSARAGPWDQDNDSGNGAASTTDATIAGARRVDLAGDTPLQYWAFVSVAVAEAVYIVVETTAGKYVHFGFGELQKFNDWNGGSYAYGARHTATTSDNGTRVGNSYLLDGLSQDGSSPDPTNGMELFMATIRADGLPLQAAAGLYGVVGGNQSDKGLDRQSNGGGVDTARVMFVGGFRGNQFATDFGQALPSLSKGFVPGYPIAPFYWDQAGSTTIFGPMGVMKDVRGINLDQFVAEQEVVISGDTWVLFPSRKRSDSATESDTSIHQGIMYKQN